MILRRFAACVTREPQEVFDYTNTIKAAENLFHSNQTEPVHKKDDRLFMFESCETDLDNFSEMMNGNDPRSYQLGPDWDRRNQVI